MVESNPPGQHERDVVWEGVNLVVMESLRVVWNERINVGTVSSGGGGDLGRRCIVVRCLSIDSIRRGSVFLSSTTVRYNAARLVFL